MGGVGVSQAMKEEDKPVVGNNPLRKLWLLLKLGIGLLTGKEKKV